MKSPGTAKSRRGKSRDRKIEADQSLPALALQDGGPSEHSFHFKPVGDTLAQGVHRKFAVADGSRARSVSGTGGKVYYIIIENNELKDMKLLFIILSLIIDHFLLL
jgi:hypothetical protein